MLSQISLQESGCVVTGMPYKMCVILFITCFDMDVVFEQEKSCYAQQDLKRQIRSCFEISNFNLVVNYVTLCPYTSLFNYYNQHSYCCLFLYYAALKTSSHF